MHGAEDDGRVVAIGGDERHAQRPRQAAARLEHEALDAIGIPQRVEQRDPRPHGVADQRDARRGAAEAGSAHTTDHGVQPLDDQRNGDRSARRRALAVAGEIGNDQPIVRQ